MEASKTIRHQIGPNGESGKKMEWVTPKISLMGAVDTHGTKTGFINEFTEFGGPS